MNRFRNLGRLLALPFQAAYAAFCWLRELRALEDDSDQEWLALRGLWPPCVKCGQTPVEHNRGDACSAFTLPPSLGGANETGP